MLRVANIIGPISFALFTILTGLKWCEEITWDWVWVISPLWITFYSLFALVYITLKNKKTLTS
jgi:hypothetical protein